MLSSSSSPPLMAGAGLLLLLLVVPLLTGGGGARAFVVHRVSTAAPLRSGAVAPHRLLTHHHRRGAALLVPPPLAARKGGISEEEEEEETIISDSSDSSSYLSPADDPTIIYKRLDEDYDIEGYEGAFPVQDVEMQDFLALNGEGEVMLRILVVGGGVQEAEMVKKLCAEENLVTGTYVSWDPKVCELESSMGDIEFNNLLPCERPDLPVQQAELAWFLNADLVIVGESYRGDGSSEFVSSLCSEVSKKGISVLGVDDASKIRRGDFSKLLEVQGTITSKSREQYRGDVQG